jgi:hypothetical protein
MAEEVQAWWTRTTGRPGRPLPLLGPILTVNALVLGTLGLIDLIDLGHTWFRGYKLLGGAGLLGWTVVAYVVLFLLNVLGFVFGAWGSLGRRPFLGLAALVLGATGIGRVLTLLVTDPGPGVIGLIVGEVIAAPATLLLVFRPDRSAGRGPIKKPDATEAWSSDVGVEPDLEPFTEETTSFVRPASRSRRGQ